MVLVANEGIEWGNKDGDDEERKRKGEEKRRESLGFCKTVIS